MKASVCFAMIVLVVGLGTRLGWADDGFTLSDLNPFSRSEASSQRVASRPPAAEGRGFRLPAPPSLSMPELPRVRLPQWSFGRAPQKPRRASTWRRIQQGTRSFWTTTRHTLMPWTKETPVRRSATGARRVETGEDKSFFPSWFTSSGEESEIRTVNDYLSLPRPMP